MQGIEASHIPTCQISGNYLHKILIYNEYDFPTNGQIIDTMVIF